MAFGNVNSVSAAKSATKSTPYGTLKGFISPYNSGSSKLCEGVGDTLECWGYTGTKVTFYGTHDAIHTTGYHVYTSTQY